MSNHRPSGQYYEPESNYTKRVPENRGYPPQAHPLSRGTNRYRDPEALRDEYGRPIRYGSSGGYNARNGYGGYDKTGNYGNYSPTSDYNSYHNDYGRNSASHGYPSRQPQQYPWNEGLEPPRKQKRSHPVRNILLVLLLVLFAAGAFASFQIDSRLHDFPPEVQKSLDNKLAPSALLGIQPVNVLLLGSDARADDPAMGARTDAIVLCRVDPLAKTVNMLSIPRDTMVDIPEHGTSKINAAYAFNGPSGAVAAVEQLCGTKIDHCAVVDFSGLAALVDNIGGIDVFLDEPINNPKAGEATLEAGQQHINGAQALVMSRDRDYADGDYTRQSNQRKVISGIANRILNMPPWEMPAAMSGFAECLSTDTGTGCLGIALTLVRMKVPWAKMQMHATVLPSQPATIDGISYVICDKAATKELMSRFQNADNIEDPLSTSSIEEDLATAG